MSRPGDPHPWRRRARNLGIVAAVAAAAVLLWSWLFAPREVRREPGLRVLLITIDTLRADAVGAYGNPRAHTPWIDRLAAAGIRFAEARAHNVTTLPSHANILAGRYPFDHGVRDNGGFRFPSTQDTLATLLSARGYRTGAFVSAFPLDSRFGLDRGFDVYDDSVTGAEPQTAFLVQERAGVETVARARAWLDTPDPRPAFCWIHLYEPHFPYPRGYEADVSAADAALAPLLAPILGDARAPAGGLPKEGVDRTLVVLTSDHGESLGEHGESTHGIFAYDSTLLVPLVLHAPRLLRPAVLRGAARHVDILPTILDAIDVPAPAGLPGRSLLPLAAGEREAPVATYFEALSGQLNRGWAPLYGVVRGSRKFIDLPIPELFDLAADPSEQRNLADFHPDGLRELHGVLASIRPDGESVVRTAESADTLEQLRSLGYVAHGSADRPRGARQSRGPRDADADTRVDAGSTRFEEADDPKRLIGLDALLQEVVGRYLDGDLGGALERCRELVRRRPSMAVSLLHLAHLERAGGDLGAGIDALKKALALAPDDANALSLLGAYLGEAGRADEAVAWLEEAARRSDADPQVLVSYGLALAKLGRHEQALAPFDRAVAQDPASPKLLVERGTAHMMAGRRERARLDFEAAVAQPPAPSRAYTSLGVLAVEDGRPGEALAHWHRAVTLDPGEHRTLLALGLFHWRAGRRDAARPYLDFFAASAPPDRYERELARVRDMRTVR